MSQHQEETKLSSEVQVVRRPQKLYKPRRMTVIPRVEIMNWLRETYPAIENIPRQRTIDNWLKYNKIAKVKSFRIMGSIYVNESDLRNLVEKKWPNETQQ